MRYSGPRSRSRYQIFLRLFLFVATFLGGQTVASAIDDPISIGSITVNPQANNRRAVILKGTVKEIRAAHGTDPIGFQTCGQTFTLEDSTGSIEVWYLIKCRQGESVVVVGEGDQAIVYATIDAPPITNMKTSTGLETGYKAMATKLVRGKQ
jgi:hypothetical protein